MATKLEKALKREISIGGEPFVVTLTPGGMKLVGKGRRKGLEFAWEDLTSGDAAGKADDERAGSNHQSDDYCTYAWASTIYART